MAENTIAVIGGGAAGFFAAIACAEAAPQSRVILLEKSAKPLAKVRISGGGRCNVTHHCFEARRLVGHYPRGHRELMGPFHRFQPEHTVAWFEQRGVELKTEPDGRMFPVTDDSDTIVRCLMESADAAGVELQRTCAIRSIKCDDGVFKLEGRSGDSMAARCVLLATGSLRDGHALAHSFGHTIVPPVPSLFTFNVPDSPLLDLAGVSVPQAKVSIPSAKLFQQGPLLITHWGFSGPAVLKLSAWAARALHASSYSSLIEINWLGEVSSSQAQEALRQMQKSRPNKAIDNACPFKVPKRLWQRMIELSDLDPGARWTTVSHAKQRVLAEKLTCDRYQLDGKTTYKEEFVTCGGVKLSEVDLKTMESKLCPGLFFAGEILDVDGVTGGFNFQNAWTTGWLAGHAMAEK